MPGVPPTLHIYTLVCTRCSAGWEVEGVNLELDRIPVCPLCERASAVEVRDERRVVPIG